MAGLSDLNRLPQSGDGSEPTYRMSMLPFGTYANSDGTESLGFALPAMIHEPLMAVERLFGTPSRPGTFGRGPDYPGNADAMRTLLLSTYGGNALNPARLMEGAAARAAPEITPRALGYGDDTARWFLEGDKPVFTMGGIDPGATVARQYGPELAAQMDAHPYMDSVMPVNTLDGQPYLHRTWYKPGEEVRAHELSELATSTNTKTKDHHRQIGLALGYPDEAVEKYVLGRSDLLSDTGKPSLMGSAIAGAETPQRMYHGTTAAEDFSTFRPSESGSFGPGVYVSRDPEFAGTFAPEGTGARMLPLDVDGPLATMEQYLKTLHANGRNPEAAQRVLLGQGYTGVFGDIGGSKFSDVTNVFKPGSIRSATTGETLYSDSLPSLFPAALYDNQEPQSSYASGGNVADTSGLSGLTRLPDYGFGPMTPTTIAGRPNDFVSSRDPDPTWGDLALSAAEFPARATVGQIDAAGQGIADALIDPSLANVTNAGVNTGLALMSPELTVASGLGGLGLAALRDADVIPSAEARRLRHPAPVAAAPAPLAPAHVDPVLEKVKDDPSLLALYQQIKIEQNNATRDYPGRNGDASRAAAAARVQDLQGQFSAALAKRDAAKQAIYDQQVTNALAARDVELGRDRRFSDTEVGKVYDKLGGYAPLVAGFVPGVVSRLAYGPAKTLGNALLRDAEGITFGIGANNVPLAYNSFATEVDNPEQRAYAAYAYNLPDGHPDKVKAQAMADSLPKLNPIREESQEELYDPEKLKERAIMGGFEGWGGNRLGQMLTGGLGGLFRRSSYQLPPEAPLPVKPQGPVSPAPLGAVEELAARKDEALRRSLGPDGPAGERSLPVLGDVSDTVPVSPTPKQKAGRRSRSGGSKGPSKAGTVSSDNPPALPDSQSAASDELKRFLGFRKAPDLKDLKAAGGGVDGAGEGGKTFSGPLHAASGGRTDVLPVDVAAGSYVLPADLVSALGEGNTTHGVKIIEQMFPAQNPNLTFASGGKVPIIAAGGEHVLSPEQVAAVGGGDLNHGHAILDAFVKNTRNDTINTLKSLPGPQK